MRHLSHKKNKTNKCKITFSKLFADNPAKKTQKCFNEEKKGGGKKIKERGLAANTKKNKDNKQQKKENKIHPLSNPLIL